MNIKLLNGIYLKGGVITPTNGTRTIYITGARKSTSIPDKYTIEATEENIAKVNEVANKLNRIVKNNKLMVNQKRSQIRKLKEELFSLEGTKTEY